MAAPFSFRLIASDGAARRGEITTPHGRWRRRPSCPAGRRRRSRLAPDAVRAAGTDILLANTYHLTLRPGAERIAALGGLHAFMNWPHRS